MSRLKLALLLASAVFLASCTSTYKRETITPAQNKLSLGGSAIVATPLDSAYGDEKYPGSGVATASAIQSAFARYTTTTDISAACSDFECLKSSSKSYNLYVVSKILHWEDRATEWSGKKDKIEIKITIYSPDGTVLASNIINGKSKWATFGGDHPQDLLPDPLGEYVRSLY